MKYTLDKDALYPTRVTVKFEDGKRLMERREALRSVNSGLTNEEIVRKRSAITENAIDKRRREEIKRLVLGWEDLAGFNELAQLLDRRAG